MVGKTVAKLGISAESMQNEEHGFHTNIEGKYYYCIFKKIETRYMGSSSRWTYCMNVFRLIF